LKPLLAAAKPVRALVCTASSAEITIAFPAAREPSRIGGNGYTSAATGASSTCVESIVRQQGPRCRDPAKQAFGREGQQVVEGSSATSRRTAHGSTCG